MSALVDLSSVVVLSFFSFDKCADHNCVNPNDKDNKVSHEAAKTYRHLGAQGTCRVGRMGRHYIVLAEVCQVLRSARYEISLRARLKQAFALRLRNSR